MTKSNTFAEQLLLLYWTKHVRPLWKSIMGPLTAHGALSGSYSWDLAYYLFPHCGLCQHRLVQTSRWGNVLWPRTLLCNLPSHRAAWFGLCSVAGPWLGGSLDTVSVKHFNNRPVSDGWCCQCNFWASRNYNSTYLAMLTSSLKTTPPPHVLQCMEVNANDITTKTTNANNLCSCCDK